MKIALDVTIPKVRCLACRGAAKRRAHVQPGSAAHPPVAERRARRVGPVRSDGARPTAAVMRRRSTARELRTGLSVVSALLIVYYCRTMANNDERAVLVTGASSGIGRACALHLDHLGFKVFAGYRRQADAALLRGAASNRLEPVYLDVTEADSIAASVGVVRRSVGERGLFALVNNAGIAIAAPLEFLSIEDLRRQLEVNVIGQVSVTQSFLPLVREAKGRIVMVGSIGGRVSWPGLGPYCASKFALEALTDALRMEVRQFGLRVTIVEPGNVDTPIWTKSLAEVERTIGTLSEEARSLYASLIDASTRAVQGIAGAGVPPGKVARTIARVLMANRPRARYLLGWDAKLLVALRRYLPVGMIDWIILRVLLRS